MSRWRWGLVLAGVALLVINGHALAVHLESFSAGLRARGAWGALLFIGAFAVASAAFVPAGPLTMMSGALFGIGTGTACAFLGAALGAVLAFLLSRYAARATVERWLARNPRMAAIAVAVGGHGRVVALLRLSPVIPFSVINVVMGVTSIRFVDFVVANLAMLPVTALYAYYGAAAGALVTAHGAEHPRDAAYWILLVVGLAATVAVTTLVTRVATRALARETGITK